ncbi:MmgE/PrpD family protein [Paraburkholderia caffeinilytica]|uniref:MmgE/PrpD family protein n=1 Tax=Paraburkholderia caffeinilytica TaxID=1761016 RepID=UPI003DA08D82
MGRGGDRHDSSAMMSLLAWAERLASSTASPGVDLVVADTAAAFWAGLDTPEGRALAALNGDCRDTVSCASTIAAIARLSECDDIHLAGGLTPGAIVVPCALAVAADEGGADDSGDAITAGYVAGIELGQAIGGFEALARGVWPTLFCAPLIAAVTVGVARRYAPLMLAHAMALALAGASGRIGRPHGMPSGRWLLFGEAVARGVRAADAAGHGFRGDLSLVTEEWLHAAAGGGKPAFPTCEALSPGLETVGFKPFVTARQGANAIVAFQHLLSLGMTPEKITHITAFVPHANVALLIRPLEAADRLSTICNLGFQLACAAFAPDLLYKANRDERQVRALAGFAARVDVRHAQDLDAYFPNVFPASLEVEYNGRRHREVQVHLPLDAGQPDRAHSLFVKWDRLLTPERSVLCRRTTDADSGDRHGRLWDAIVQSLQDALPIAATL